MAKFECFVDCDYVCGHFRYAHYEGVVEANSAEEAREMVLETPYLLDFVLDDYRIDDCPIDTNSISIREIK